MDPTTVKSKSESAPKKAAAPKKAKAAGEKKPKAKKAASPAKKKPVAKSAEKKKKEFFNLSKCSQKNVLKYLTHSQISSELILHLARSV